MKGLSCFFIIIAHSTVLLNDPVLKTIFLGSNIFTMIYFSSSGALAGIQAGRERLSRIVMLYGFLFFLGFAYDAIIAKHYFTSIDSPPGGKIFISRYSALTPVKAVLL